MITEAVNSTKIFLIDRGFKVLNNIIRLKSSNLYAGSKKNRFVMKGNTDIYNQLYIISIAFTKEVVTNGSNKVSHSQ